MKIRLVIEQGVEEEVEVRALGNLEFELIETPLMGYPELSCGDIARFRFVKEDHYEVEEVISRPYLHTDYIIPGTYGASECIYEFGEWLTARGGRWECVMGGMLFVHLPPGQSITEVETELEARLDQFLGSEEHAKQLELGPPSLRGMRPDAGTGQMWISANSEEDQAPQQAPQAKPDESGEGGSDSP